MTTTRCDKCRFWIFREQYSGRADPHDHEDDQTGTCHRHAPAPPPGQVAFEVLTHLTTIAWEHAGERERANDFKNWEEAHIERCTWPVTRAADWCGDFQSGPQQESPQ